MPATPSRKGDPALTRPWSPALALVAAAGLLAAVAVEPASQRQDEAGTFDDGAGTGGALVPGPLEPTSPFAILPWDAAPIPDANGTDQPPPSTVAEPNVSIAFGMDAKSIDAQRAAGFQPDLGTLWLGPWTLEHGWGEPDVQLREMAREGITPAVHVYYWGDDLSPRCLEHGCWSSLHEVHKDREGWQRLVEETVEHFERTLDG